MHDLFEVERPCKADPGNSCVSKEWGWRGIWYRVPELQGTEAPLWLRPQQITSKHLYLQCRSTKWQLFSSHFPGCKYCLLKTFGLFFSVFFEWKRHLHQTYGVAATLQSIYLVGSASIEPFTIQTLIQQWRELTGTFAADLNQRQRLEQYKAIWASQQSRADLLPVLLQPQAWLRVLRPREWQHWGKPAGPSQRLPLLCCCPMECYHYDNLQV